jgi:hypothetical protein
MTDKEITEKLAEWIGNWKKLEMRYCVSDPCEGFYEVQSIYENPKQKAEVDVKEIGDDYLTHARLLKLANDRWKECQQNKKYLCGLNEHNYWDVVPNYLGNIADAWMLVEKEVERGACPALINDDNGHWALVFDSFGTAPMEKNEIYDATTTFFVEKGMWYKSAPRAICMAVLKILEDK